MGQQRVAGFVAALAVAAGGAVFPCRAGAAEPIRINGSGSALDLVELLLRAYVASHPEARFQMDPPLGSSGATMALLAGALDLAVLTRPVLPEEEARGARGRLYGRMPLLFVANPGVPVSDVTTADAEAIYAGLKTSWPDGQPIRLVLRPERESKTKVLQSLSAKMKEALQVARQRPWAIVAVTDPESDEMVSRTPGAIGATNLPALTVNRVRLKPLTLDGIPASARTLADGKYPLASEIIFVTGPRTPPAALDLVEFAWSAEGRAIAAGAGVLVTGRSEAR